jgi:hypothetical protein
MGYTKWVIYVIYLLTSVRPGLVSKYVDPI